MVNKFSKVYNSSITEMRRMKMPLVQMRPIL